MKLRTKITLFSSLFIFMIVLLINTIIYLLFYNISTDNELNQLSNQTDAILETLNENPDILRKIC